MRALAVALAVGGCAPLLPPLTCPQLGGPPWTEASSPHFLLRTDLPAAEARRALEEGELAFQTLEQIFRSELPEAPPLWDEPIRVAWFRHAQDQAALFPDHPNGGFYYLSGNDWEPLPAIVMTSEADGALLLRHELTHHLVRHFLPARPAWLDEGLAQLYSALHVDGGRAIIGSWHPSFEQHGDQADVRELFSAGESGFHDRPGYYTEAQALVHLLQSERRGHRPRFVDYLRRLSTGIRADLAWSQSFAGVDLDGLERTLNGYRFISLRTDTRTLPVTTHAAAVSTRLMSDAEVHLLWLELRPWSNANLPQAAHDLERALRTEPASPRAKYWRARFAARRNQRDVTAMVEEALAADPGNGRLLQTLLRWTSRPELTPRLAEVAKSAPQLLAMAWMLPPEARLPAARRAVAARPDCGDCWSTVAYLAVAAGQAGEAVAAMRRAAWLLPESGFVLARLRQYGDPEPAPPPWRAAYGVTVAGRLVDGRGRAVAAWVHAASGGQFDMVRASADGSFHLRVPPGVVDLWALPDDATLLADHWPQRPSQRQAGRRRRLPAHRRAYPAHPRRL